MYSIYRRGDLLPWFIFVLTICSFFVGAGKFAKSTILQDSALIQLLRDLHGNPKLLSITEINQLRANSPSAVEKYMSLLNNPSLLEDLANKRVSTETFEDLKRSLVFLDTAHCMIQETSVPLPCFVIKEPIDFPRELVIAARFSSFIPRFVDPSRLVLYVYKMSAHYEGQILPVVNGSELVDVYETKRLNNQEGYWDVTDLMRTLQKNEDLNSYPIIITLRCIEDDCSPLSGFFKTLFGSTPQLSVVDSEIIMVLQLFTANSLNTQYRYEQRRLHKRSTTEVASFQEHKNVCPSFLNFNRHQAKCCLFRYTLNKEQLDSNDMLRFIVFPHYLPLNLCHGRCIGLFMPTDNNHSVLLNRYFSGLNDEEKDAIYASMPCCAANETGPFTFMYKDENNRLYKETLHRAVKLNCACG